MTSSLQVGCLGWPKRKRIIDSRALEVQWGSSSNDLGQLVGVNVGGNPRRGTTLSISVRELAEFLNQNSIRFSYSGKSGFSEKNQGGELSRYGKQLRDEGVVSLIACNRTSRQIGLWVYFDGRLIIVS